MCAGGATGNNPTAPHVEIPALIAGGDKAPVSAKDDVPPQCPDAKLPKEPGVPAPPKKQPNEAPKEPAKECAKESVNDGAPAGGAPARKDPPKASKNVQVLAPHAPCKAALPNGSPKNPEAKQPKEPGIPNPPKEPLGNEVPKGPAKESAKEPTDGDVPADGAPVPKDPSKAPANVHLLAPQTPGKEAPQADRPPTPPKGSTPEENKMISAPTDVKSQAEDAGATHPDNVHVSDSGDVYASNKDGSWKHPGQLDRGALVRDPSTPGDPAHMDDLPENADLRGAIPTGAIPKVDSFGNVWDMFNPNHPRYLGHLVNDMFYRAHDYRRSVRPRRKRRARRLKGVMNPGKGS